MRGITVARGRRAGLALAPFLLLAHATGCGEPVPDPPTAGTDSATNTSGTTSAASSTSASTGTSAGPTAGSPTGSTGSTGSSTGSTGSSTGSTGSTGTSSGGSTGALDPCVDQDEPAPEVAPPGALNDDPAYIHVYVNNIENLKTVNEQCPGDWKDLIYYMKSIAPSPDLFLVQQLSDTAQLAELIQFMDDELPGAYAGIIADEDPWTQNSPCGPEKEKQTNAIVYRVGRFSPVGEKHVWQVQANKNNECVENHQARTRSVMALLHDDIADRTVTAASIHWSTFQGDGDDPACAEINVAETDTTLHMEGFAADLVVFGGDFNEPDHQADAELLPWHATANGDAGGSLNYRDPIFRDCQLSGDLHACLDANWTGVNTMRRVDMLFAQDRDRCRAKTARAHTITFAEGDAADIEFTGNDNELDYSDHRAIRAEVYFSG